MSSSLPVVMTNVSRTRPSGLVSCLRPVLAQLMGGDQLPAAQDGRIRGRGHDGTRAARDPPRVSEDGQGPYRRGTRRPERYVGMSARVYHFLNSSLKSVPGLTFVSIR